MVIMSEKAMYLAKEYIKNIFLEINPQLTENQADSMANENVDAIDWNDSDLMQKDLRLIANNYYDCHFAK